jgi:hypothetical protein
MEKNEEEKRKRAYRELCDRLKAVSAEYMIRESNRGVPLDETASLCVFCYVELAS